MAKFGKLIHKYTIKDGAIVPLIYEGRFVDQKADEENNDLWFKQTTKRLTDAQKEDLRKKMEHHSAADLDGCPHQAHCAGHQ